MGRDSGSEGSRKSAGARSGQSRADAAVVPGDGVTQSASNGAGGSGAGKQRRRKRGAVSASREFDVSSDGSRAFSSTTLLLRSAYAYFGKARVRQRLAYAGLVLALIAVSLLFVSSFIIDGSAEGTGELSRHTRGFSVEDGGFSTQDAAPVQRRRRRRRPRKHLHEICPHIVKKVTEPYSNKYIVSHGPAPSRTKQLFDLTNLRRGNTPIILSVPHGASGKETTFSWQARHLAPRSGASEAFNASDFQSRLSRVSTDTNTIQIANELADAFKKRFKKSIYVVSAKVHRKFVDLNRRVNGSEACCQVMWPKCTAVADYQYKGNIVDEEHASRVNAARVVYDHYHETIIDAINEASRAHPNKPIWVIDVHAQKATDDDELGVRAEDMLDTVIVGTQDGRLVNNRGELYAQGGLLDDMQRNGLKVYPPDNSVPDHPKYNGGHLVAEYGFNNTVGHTVNALQMEFGFNLRIKTKNRAKAVSALVTALHNAIQ